MSKRLNIIVPLTALVIGTLTFWLIAMKTPKAEVGVEIPLYIALGDSVAAGAGLETSSDTSACDRNNESYPNIVASLNKLELRNYACSGATTTLGINGGQTVNNLLLKPQLDQVFEGSPPKYITMTVGANDIGWSNILLRCATTVCGTAEDNNIIEAELATLTTNLKTIFETIKTKYTTDIPKVIVTGYYEIFPISAKPCTSIPGIDNAEQQWWNAQGSKLNQTIVSAGASYSFIEFALPSFINHDLCSNEPWVQGLQDEAPFHPNNEGQKAIAESVTKFLKQ